MNTNVELFVHPEDSVALKMLQKVPGFDLATKWVMKLGVEQYCRGLYMANHIRLSSKQLPKIYNLLPPICEKLGIDVPELYLQMHSSPSAYTIGDQRNYIVLTSGLVDCLSNPEEMSVALAHECGHIACRHVFYSTMVQMMFNLGCRYEIVRQIQEPLALAYNHWVRASELTADRASAYCHGGVLAPIRCLLRLAGGPSRITAELSIEEYVQQMAESEAMCGDKKWQRLLRDFSEQEDDHPYTSRRIKELFLWGRSTDFH